MKVSVPSNELLVRGFKKFQKQHKLLSLFFTDHHNYYRRHRSSLPTGDFFFRELKGTVQKAKGENVSMNSASIEPHMP